MRVDDFEIPKLGTWMTNAFLEIRPIMRNYADLELELFFEEDYIILEMH